MKKLLLSCLLFLSISSFAQLEIPLFDIPQKVESLSDDAEEQTPVTFNKGEGMFFNRFYEKVDEDGGVIKAQDIWYASNGKKSWGNPYRAFRDVDGREIKILIGCTRDGERLYLLNRYFEGDSIKHRIVYKSRKGKHTWKDPIEVAIPNVDLSDQQTTLFMHSDEDVLLVSMLTKDTSAVPNEDLYLVHKKEDGTWSELIDLGPNINTKGLEFSPFLTHDKTKLYFASNGHDGFGESDIFVSYREGDGWDSWSRPLNLGLPINSSAFESSFVISDTNQVYFSSDRDDSNTNLYFTKATGKTKMANLGILAGQLMKDGEPLAAVKFNAYDLKGNFLETVETDAEGRFVFKKLVPDDKFEIKMDVAVEEDLSGSKLYLVDQDGDLKKRIVFDEEGKDLADNSPKDTPETTEDSTIVTEKLEGFFLEGGTPLLNTALIVQDETGFPIDTIYTNDIGKFSYSKLSTDNEVFFVPRDVAVDNDALDLYLVDDLGKRTESYLGEEAGAEDLFGKFSYNKLPLGNTAIAVLDDDGNVIDTIYTDATGFYKYRKLKSDNASYFVPLDQDNLNMEDLVLHEVNETGKTMKKLSFDSTSGLFAELTDDEDALALAEKAKLEKENQIVEKIETKKKVEKVDKVEPGRKNEMDIHETIVLQFGFNQTFLGSINSSKLSTIIGQLKANENLKISITGHADNIGSDEVNNRISLKRAEAVKKYFVTKGIDSKRISASGDGETNPIASNDTEEGRDKNRRAEIKFK
jgi:outer membrane protein OmpA-like peptidoglycan-associated protein